MSPVKYWIKRCARFTLMLIPALALATPGFAQRSPLLADSQEPGSVLVFPKFLTGTQVVDGVTLPSTEIEVGIVCPAGPPFFAAGCPEHQVVKLRFHWVCPGFQDFNTKLICRENNFEVIGTVNGKLVFNPNNMTITGSNAVNVPSPPCPMGYLIGGKLTGASLACRFFSKPLRPLSVMSCEKT